MFELVLSYFKHVQFSHYINWHNLCALYAKNDILVILTTIVNCVSIWYKKMNRRTWMLFACQRYGIQIRWMCESIIAKDFWWKYTVIIIATDREEQPTLKLNNKTNVGLLRNLTEFSFCNWKNCMNNEGFLVSASASAVLGFLMN